MIGMRIGAGAYSVAEAAALIDVPAARVRRWACGEAALVRDDTTSGDGRRTLTFVELIELLYVGAFVRCGVPWRHLREAARVAARLAFGPHPFASRRFLVDATGIHAALRETDGGESVVHLAGHGQQALASIVRPYLAQLDFDAEETAARWYPLGREGGIVLDPERSFGAPRVVGAEVPAATLAAAVHAESRGMPAEEARRKVAWWFDVEPRHVDAALRFDGWLRARAA